MRWAAPLAAAGLLLSACGGAQDVATVAPLAAVHQPGPSGGDGGGGDGGGGGGGEGAQASEDPKQALATCLHRFGDVAIEPDETWDHWRRRGAQPTWRAVSEALDERFNHTEAKGEPNDSKSLVARALDLGYVASLFDSPRDRIVVVVDPDLVDVDDLERDLQQVADRTQRAEPVRDGAIAVEVFASCVPASQLVGIRSEVRRDFRELDLASGSGPRIDSRFEYRSRTEAGRREIERRYGDLVETGTGDGDEDLG